MKDGDIKKATKNKQLLENWQRSYFRQLAKKGLNHSPLYFKDMENGKFTFNPPQELESLYGKSYEA